MIGSMRTTLALFALFLALGLANGARAGSFSCSPTQPDEHASASVQHQHTEAVHSLNELGNECNDGCRWNGFCSNPSICQHCGVVAFEIPSPFFIFEPHGRVEYSAGPPRLQRFSVSYSIIDPPRA